MDIVFECMRLGMTDLQSKCTCHHDEHNSFNPAFSAVWSTGGLTGGLYFDFVEPDQQQCFAARMHMDDMFECMHLSMMGLQSKCACHHDEHKSFNPAFSAVWSTGGLY
jgi:hypothetical protein